MASKTHMTFQIRDEGTGEIELSSSTYFSDEDVVYEDNVVEELYRLIRRWEKKRKVDLLEENNEE